MFFGLSLPFCKKNKVQEPFLGKETSAKLSHFKLPSDIPFVITFLRKAFYKQAKKMRIPVNYR